jgi:hypothetical protein
MYRLLFFSFIQFWIVGSVLAQNAGEVVNLSGPLFSIKAEGVRQVLSVGSAVTPGDTLITEAKTYARVKFTDASEITLRPDTQFKIENYAFVQADPSKDNVVLRLFKGALRTITGLVGKRGNQDAYRLSTPTATIGIRGTQYIAEFIPAETRVLSRVPHALPLLASADSTLSDTGPTTDIVGGLFSLPPDLQTLTLAQLTSDQECDRSQANHTCDDRPSPARRQPGLYVQVIDGQILLSNLGGSQFFSAGQFGFVSSPTQSPVILPQNPGIIFNPPSVVGGLSKNVGLATDGQQPGSQPRDGCEVR